MITPKKALGQHFLKDDEIAQRIVNSLNADADNIIEVGPGMGVLTRHLEKIYGDRLHVIELDERAVAYLSQKYPALVERIISSDILKVDFSRYFKGDIAVIGNFPYNISSQIVFKILENKHSVVEMVGMFQKEVAKRICSGPGSKEYGILSVFVQAFYKTEYLFEVHENSFDPPPKVKSAVIRLVLKEQLPATDEEKFFKVVKKAFGQRRKTLRNAMKDWLHSDIAGEDIFNKRAEQLTVEDFLELTRRFSK